MANSKEEMEIEDQMVMEQLERWKLYLIGRISTLEYWLIITVCMVIAGVGVWGIWEGMK